LNISILLFSSLFGGVVEAENSTYYIETGAYATIAELEQLAANMSQLGLVFEIDRRESLDGHDNWYGFLVGITGLLEATTVANTVAAQGGRGVGVYTGHHPTQATSFVQEEVGVQLSQREAGTFVPSGAPEVSLIEIQRRLMTLHRSELMSLLSQDVIFKFIKKVHSGGTSEAVSYQYLRNGNQRVAIGEGGESLPNAQQYSPEALLALYAESVGHIVNPPVYGTVRLQASGTYRGRRAQQFVYEDETRTAVIVTSRDGHLIFSVSDNSSAGEVQYQFHQWREMGGGAVLPLVTEVLWQGQLVETIEVREISLSPQFSEEYDLYFENP